MNIPDFTKNGSTVKTTNARNCLFTGAATVILAMGAGKKAAKAIDGAVNSARLGLFDVSRKEFISKEFSGAYELVGLTGNITTMKDQIYLHLHASIADSDCNLFEGHLALAVISAACEIIIDRIDGKVDRVFDDQIGLNVLNI